MGAAHSVTLVSNDVEVQVPVLSSASKVWRERRKDTSSLPFTESPKSKEDRSKEEIDAFVVTTSRARMFRCLHAELVGSQW